MGTVWILQLNMLVCCLMTCVYVCVCLIRAGVSGVEEAGLAVLNATECKRTACCFSEWTERADREKVQVRGKRTLIRRYSSVSVVLQRHVHLSRLQMQVGLLNA